MPIIACKIIEVCIFKFERDQPWYLLLHRSKDEKIYPGIWQFVSGSIEGNESAVDAALRELSEETGISPKAFWVVPHVNMFYDPGYDAVNLSPLFAAQVEGGAEPILSAEHRTHEWMCYDEARRLLVWPGQRAGLDVVQTFILGGEEAGVLTLITV